MNHHYMIILAAGAVFLYMLVLVVIWASRYAKVGPNRVLIVSGRQYRLADGTRVGFRIVKGGGTFVFPVVEQAEVLSLEVLSIEMPKLQARTAKGVPVEADCLAQVKVKADEASILAAAEHFLSKNEGEIKNIVKPVLEKHLRTIIGSLSAEEIERDVEACAAKVQTAGCLAALPGIGVAAAEQKIRTHAARYC